MKRSPKWLRTDEREDAVRSLEWTCELADRVPGDIHVWKWLLIALHNTVQGYMVVALEKGDGLLPLRPRLATQWLRALEGKGPFPVEKLDDFLALYGKIKAPANFQTPFSPSQDEDEQITRLNGFRGYFTHFTPKGWSLELAFLPPIVIASAAVIRWATFDAGAIWYKASSTNRTKRSLSKLRRLTNAWSGRDT
jgi:hypothetical protein